ncbi:helix-turn-helix domain-containing protein [Candidatus Riflebacteria bacterium]
MRIKTIGSEVIQFLGLQTVEGDEIFFKPEDVEIFQGLHEIKIEKMKNLAKKKIKFPGPVFEITFKNGSTFLFPGYYYKEFLLKLEEALTDYEYVDGEEGEEKEREGEEDRYEGEIVAGMVEKWGFIPLELMTRRYIERVLDFTGGNKLQAAKILEIDPKTIRSRLKDS